MDEVRLKLQITSAAILFTMSLAGVDAILRHDLVLYWIGLGVAVVTFLYLVWEIALTEDDD